MQSDRCTLRSVNDRQYLAPAPHPLNYRKLYHHAPYLTFDLYYSTAVKALAPRLNCCQSHLL